jgi:hypothetical protein
VLYSFSYETSNATSFLSDVDIFERPWNPGETAETRGSQKGTVDEGSEEQQPRQWSGHPIFFLYWI